MELELNLMKEEFKNLFEAAGKLANVKKKEASHSPSQNDLDKQFVDCKTMYEEINRGLEFAFKFAEVDRHSFHSFFLRPQNFSQAEWRAVQEGKTNIEQMLKNLKEVVVPAESVIQGSKDLGSEESEEMQEKEIPSDVETKSLDAISEAPSTQPAEEESSESQQDKKPKKRMHRTRWIDMR